MTDRNVTAFSDCITPGGSAKRVRGRAAPPPAPTRPRARRVRSALHRPRVPRGPRAPRPRLPPWRDHIPWPSGWLRTPSR